MAIPTWQEIKDNRYWAIFDLFILLAFSDDRAKFIAFITGCYSGFYSSLNLCSFADLDNDGFTVWDLSFEPSDSGLS